MDRSELFLEKYKILEKAALNTYNMPQDGKSIYYLERMPRYRNVRSTLAYCRDIRNLLQHNPKVGGEDAVIPSLKIIEFLDEMIRRVENPQTCIKAAIKMGDLFYRGRGDKIYPAMEAMAKRGYSHVPVLERERVVGVFSKEVIFALLMSGKCTEELRKLTFEDISEYTGVAERGSEEYVFAKKDTLIEEAEQICEDHYRARKRIGLIFLTDTGRADEKLLGAITPWTILGHKY